MRSFAVAFIAAAFAAFTSAVPIASGGLADVASGPGHAVANGLKGAHATRSDPPSVAVIVAELAANVQPLTVKLSALETADITVDVVADISADIKAVVDIAIPKVQALIGADVEVIMAGTDGRQLTVADLQVLVAVHLKLIFVAIAKILANVDIKADVRVALVKLFVDLGVEITALIKLIVDVVVGIKLSVQVQAIAQVILDLKLNDLAKLCGIISA